MAVTAAGSMLVFGVMNRAGVSGMLRVGVVTVAAGLRDWVRDTHQRTSGTTGGTCRTRSCRR